MDALGQGGDFHAFFTPLVGADQAEEFAHGGHVGGVDFAVGFEAGFAHVGRAAQGDEVVGVEGQQQHGERAGALGLGLAVQVEGFRGGGLGLGHLGGFGGLLGLVGAAGQGLQQLAGVLEVAAPEHGGAFAGEAVGGVAGGGVVSDDDALGRGRAGF